MIALQQYDPGWEASGRELGWHDEGDKTLSPTSQGQFGNDYDDVSRDDDDDNVSHHQRRGGRVLNVSSVAGLYAYPGTKHLML